MERSKIYDATNAKSIEQYAKGMIGKTFREIVEKSKFTISIESSHKIKDESKGKLGNLVEEKYFGYPINPDNRPDFKEAGVELKVTPYEVKNDGHLSAGERLVLTMISYQDPMKTNFKESHLWSKCKLLLLVYYLRDRKKYDRLDYEVKYVKLFTPPEEDLTIIEQDYQTIAGKIIAGKANELSEADTMYLGACTKGATAESSTVPQLYYAPDVLARKRAFCYKTTYMSYVLNKYIVNNIETYEKIITDETELKDKTFEEVITQRIKKYVGKTDRELCEIFGREYNNNKAQWIDLAYRMLGIRSNRAEEFMKANVTVKAVRIEENGKMKESSSLPQIEFKKLADESWEDSELCDYLESTKFFFVVYRRAGNCYILKGCKLWNMPHDDIYGTVKKEWEAIQKVVKEGLIFTKKQTNRGVVIKNNLPTKSEQGIIHIRPKAKKSYYRIEDYMIGNNPNDGDKLPDGRIMTKQCFWFNNTYLTKQLDEIIYQG